MTPYARWGRRGGLFLPALALAMGGAAGCAPDCYDDGLFQTPGCNAAGGDGSDTSTTGTTTETGIIGTGSGDTVIMTGDAESGSSTGPTICPGLDQELSFGTLTFQIVVEQSNAMLVAFDGASRWSAVEDALVDAPDGEVTERQSLTRFGLTAYHGLQAACPDIEAVPPQLDAADEIANVFALGMPSGANPVADTIDEVTQDLEVDAWDGEKTIVLVLGDEPTTCAIPAPANALQLAETRDEAEAAVTLAYDAGYPTVVVTLGEDIDAGFLQVLANAGAGHQAGDPDASYYVTHDDSELTAAFAAIFDPGRPCSFLLDLALPLELAPGCTVQVNGMAVDYDDPNGWSRPDEQTLELQGTACEAIQQGDATVEMVCNCDDV
jgi:hypothetical protein